MAEIYQLSHLANPGAKLVGRAKPATLLDKSIYLINQAHHTF
jgi:hypothetical protein